MSKNETLELFSFSKLDTYLECSYKYKFKYVDKVEGRFESSIETTVGSWVHDALELFYSSDSSMQPYDYFTNNWKDLLTSYNLYDQFTEFTYLASITGGLYLRARADYTGPNPLRTKTGAIATKPDMLTEFKAELAKTDFYKRKAALDLKMSKKSPTWRDISAVDCFCQASFLCYNYKNPEEIHEVYAVEMGLSSTTFLAADPVDPSKPYQVNNTDVTTTREGPHPIWYDSNKKSKIISVDNKVELTKSSLLNGYIDLVSKTKTNKLCIIDHKTSSGDAPELYKVARHNQLLLYGWAVTTLSGEKPDFIGINHIKTGKLVMAPYDHDYAQQVVDSKIDVVKAIEAKAFIKRDPYAYGSPCVKKLATGTRYCPYIDLCHPWLEIS